MGHSLVQKYIKAYTLEALDATDQQIPQAADYLAAKKEPGWFAKHRQEKKAALTRVRKVFDSSRNRSLWILFKSLGLDKLAKDAL